MIRTLLKKFRARKSPRRPYRPLLESLEDRLNPAPTAILTLPTGGAILSGINAEFYGDGSDPAGVVRAEFYVDGILKSTDVNSTGHYHFGGDHNRFDTTTFANGPHLLQMVVYNPMGESGSAQANVIMSNLAPLIVTALTSTPTGFTAQFNRAIDPSTINLLDTQTGGLGAADVTLVGATTGAVPGSLVIDPTGRSITFLRTGGVLEPDTYTVTLRSGGTGFKDTTGALLDGNNNATLGDNYTNTFTIASSSAVVVSVPDLMRGPGQMVNIPATGVGLPLRLSNGSGVTSASLTLNYNTNLLNITAAAVESGVPTGANVSLNTSTPGMAVLTFTSPTALGAGAIDFVRLTAQVPASAAYTASQVLSLTSLSLNGGAVASRADNGLHLVGYLGDATANGLYTSADSLRIQRMVTGLDLGFLSFPLIDPAIVADATANGSLSSTDATRVLQEGIGIDQTVIPNLPAGVPPTVTVRATDAAAAEAGGNAGTFLLSRTGGTSSALIVNYILGGTASNGSDYISLPSSVTIAAGALSATITVSPLADVLVENNELVALTLSNSAAYTVGVSNSAAIILADDDSLSPTNYSLRFFGNGVNDIDRIKIPLDAPERPIDIGATDFTIEFWLKTTLADVTGIVSGGNDGWITGNIIFDRDIFGAGDFGDYGIALGRSGSAGLLAFGVNNGSTGATVVGARNVADGAWHHVAATRRRSDGLLAIFVDGALDQQLDGPDGDISYRNNRSTSFPNDPILVIGAEKHDAGTAFPSYSGWLDEVRISNNLRYTGAYSKPQGPFSSDANTVGLYHFDENLGATAVDSSNAAGGPSHGIVRQGGAPFGPIWTTDSPYATRVTFGLIGDYSAGSGTQDVSAVIRSWNPDFVATAGDNNYNTGSATTIDPNIGQFFHEFIYPYQGTFGPGATFNRFFPALGNHDWDNPGGPTPYFDYFTLPGNERYYEVTWGPVHLFVIDSDPREPDGIISTSIQGQWLRARLAASNAAWKIVALHHSPYSSGTGHGSEPTTQWPYEAWGADVVISGHDHIYERIVKYTTPYIITGLGGRSFHGFQATPVAGSQVRYVSDFGAVRADADRDSLTFQFINRLGQVIDVTTLTKSPTPIVNIIASDPTAIEPANPGTYTVIRTGYLDAALTVTYTIGGTATSGTDFTPLTGTVTIPAGASSATITLTPVDNPLPESTETVVLTLDAAPSYNLGLLTSATVRITDNDSPLVPLNATWRLLDNGTSQGTTWRNPGFNDSTWRPGVGQFGYGDGDETTLIGFGPDPNNKYITTYFRTTFTVTDASAFTGLLVRLLRDDGAVVYLNGTEVLRSNMPTGTITSSTLASTGISGAAENTFNETTLTTSALINGVNTLAVEIHQSAVTSSDISFHLEMLGLV